MPQHRAQERPVLPPDNFYVTGRSWAVSGEVVDLWSRKTWDNVWWSHCYKQSPSHQHVEDCINRCGASRPDKRWTIARCCGAKHISKSKCTKHTRLGPLLEVEMSKKCTPLWREAHFQVRMYKSHQVRTTFGSWDVEKVHAVVARSTLPSQKCKETMVFEPFLTFRSGKSGHWPT